MDRESCATSQTIHTPKPGWSRRHRYPEYQFSEPSSGFTIRWSTKPQPRSINWSAEENRSDLLVDKSNWPSASRPTTQYDTSLSTGMVSRGQAGSISKSAGLYLPRQQSSTILGLLIHPFSMTAGMKFSLNWVIRSLTCLSWYFLSTLDLFPAVSRGNRRHGRVPARRVSVWDALSLGTRCMWVIGWLYKPGPRYKLNLPTCETGP